MSKRRNPRKRSLFASSRQLRHEALERRELLAAEFGDYLEQPQRGGDPMLIAVSPNNGELLDLDPQDMSANRRLTAPKAMNIFIGGDQPWTRPLFGRRSVCSTSVKVILVRRVLRRFRLA